VPLLSQRQKQHQNQRRLGVSSSSESSRSSSITHTSAVTGTGTSRSRSARSVSSTGRSFVQLRGGSRSTTGKSTVSSIPLPHSSQQREDGGRQWQRSAGSHRSLAVEWRDPETGNFQWWVWVMIGLGALFVVCCCCGSAFCLRG
jgi:cobalamin biosynthesis Mg chelatase CobN